MKRDAIAIVGLACRLPGAADRDALWELLAGGVEAIGEPPAERGALLFAGESGPRAGGFVDGVDEFDARFFGMAPAEATAADPQQRLALELAWESLEDAGMLGQRRRSGPVGVFVGVMSGEYSDLILDHGLEAAGRHSLAGVSRGIVANRISGFFGFEGPSLAVDTGQSSSLAALHLSCESLHAGESDVAVAGGVSLMLSALGDAVRRTFGALSPDGRCYAFDERANGFVRGEGGGMVVLKRLGEALEDGDRIYGVIRGSALSTGRGDEGLTAPSADAQERALREALARAGTAARDVGYVELHGTGTPAGDPVEATALGAVYGRARDGAGPLPVGSIKTNIGHLEAAAGIAGLVKAVLCVQRRELVPSLNFERPNPRIALDELGLRVVSECEPWPGEGPALAGVSSFGMGGANAHLIVEEAPAARPARAGAEAGAVEGGGAPVPWLLSARSDAALRAVADRLADHLDRRPDLGDDDVAHTLWVGRARLERRAAVAGRDRDERLAALRAFAAGRSTRGVATGRARGESGGVAFMFTGQGAQRPGMAAGLHRDFPGFRSAFDEALGALDSELAGRLRELLLGAERSDRAAAHALSRTELTQPALFCFELGLFRLLADGFGVRPDFLIGHSIGELVAACAAGVLSPADGARLAAARGRLMAERCERGAMVAVAADPAVVARSLEAEPELSLAADNGPRAAAVAGPARAVADWAERFGDETGVKPKRLRVSHAFHSALVEPALEELERVCASLELRPAAIPIAANLTGALAEAGELADPGYWVAQARNPVRFGPGVRALRAAGAARFVEIGPDATLAALAEAALVAEESEEEEPLVAASQARRRPAPDALADLVARLALDGLEPDPAALFAARPRALCELPSYPWERRRHWLGHTAPPQEAADATPLSERLDGLDGERREAALLAAVQGEAAAVLGHADASAVEPRRALREEGLDSMGAVELRRRLSELSGLRLPATLVFDHPSPRALAEYLDRRLAGRSESGPRVVRPVSADDPIAIVGLACRYPAAPSAAQLWELLARGGDAVGPFPRDRGWELERLF
ncbi:MAG TPA: beta-ketoacyl synthase N-terminal-like domain-containing protein, partial [Thermoleophilaceae bacterium]